jgi:2-polyprenyl-6-methoxyphenol hydroxylase-like FAD-dependent oxidoreductase
MTAAPRARRDRLGSDAIVIGGSIAGLMTARVLADHFRTVTVLERDAIEGSSAARRCVPQGHHVHGLLHGGERVLNGLYPGFVEELERHGAVRVRQGVEIAWYLASGKAWSPTGSVRTPRDLGFDVHAQSRPLLEQCVRQRTLAHPNVRLRTGSVVQGLVCVDGRVHGVDVRYAGQPATLAADLVVDASGRGSQLPRWLMTLGFPAPAQTTIGVDLAYASAMFRLPACWAERESMLLFWPEPPAHARGAIAERIEDGLLHVSLGGRFGDYPPVDLEGFLAFAKTLYTSKLHALLRDAERVTEITPHRYPRSVQRHYERLAHFPERLLVLGDAVASFNPVFGQGMSAAALQVAALQALLVERARASHGLDGLWRAFFPRAADVISTPWELAANIDLLYPQTTGERPADFTQRVQRFAAMDVLAAADLGAHKRLVEVFNLMAPLSALWQPSCATNCDGVSGDVTKRAREGDAPPTAASPSP